LKDSRDLVPDPNFHLTAQQRRAIRPRYDAEALERLLAHLPVEARPVVLAAASDIPLVDLAALFPTFASELHAMNDEPQGAVLPPQLDDFSFDPPALHRLLEAACRRDR
jgi:hypothetical protein